MAADIQRPARAEALPRQHIDAARAEQGPQRDFHGAGIGGGHDRKPPVLRHAEQPAAPVDDLRQLFLAGRGAVGAPHQGSGQHGGRPSRPLGARPGGEVRIGRADRGFHCVSHCLADAGNLSLPPPDSTRLRVAETRSDTGMRNAGLMSRAFGFPPSRKQGWHFGVDFIPIYSIYVPSQRQRERGNDLTGYRAGRMAASVPARFSRGTAGGRGPGGKPAKCARRVGGDAPFGRWS